MVQNPPDKTVVDRPQQILMAAFLCFARKGFHQTTMQDISGEAGISVGLIYRYFANKEAVITAMAEDHKRDLALALERADAAPNLLEALDIIFNQCCSDAAPELETRMVVDLFAEAGRNSHVADLLHSIQIVFRQGLGDLIQKFAAPRLQVLGLTADEAAEIVCAHGHGMWMSEVVQSGLGHPQDAQRHNEAQRHFWRTFFGEPATSGVGGA